MKIGFKFSIVIFLVILCYSRICCESIFNFEIGARVRDQVSHFTFLISKMLNLPELKILLNETKSMSKVEAARFLFYFETVNYVSEASALYIGLATGEFAAYLSAKDPNLLKFVSSNSRVPRDLLSPNVSVYSVDKRGRSDTFLGYIPYDVLKRPWYEKAYDLKAKFWTAPYLNAGDNVPTISLIYPLINVTINGKFWSYGGAIGADVYLSQFSSFLEQEYSKTNRKVFVIDVATCGLIASSFPEDIDHPYTGLHNAATCTNSVVSGATQLLIRNDWTNQLLLFDNYFLQCSKHCDKILGLEWYIVVLLPAQVEKDHIATSDFTLYITVISVASFTAFISLVCGALTLYFYNYKMMNLTQPIVSLLVIAGCLLLCLTSVSMLGPNTLQSCTYRVFLLNLSFTFAFIPLMIKCWRVHLMFNLPAMAKKSSLLAPDICMYTLGFVVVDAILLVMTLWVGGQGTAPVIVPVLTNSGAYAHLTYCGYYNNTALLCGEVIFKGIIIMLACYLSFQTRNVVGEIAGSKAVLAIVYNTAFVSVVLLAISVPTKSTQIRIISLVVGICFCVTIAPLLLVVPVVYQIVVLGDTNAAEDVLTEVLAQSRKRSTQDARRRSQLTNFSHLLFRAKVLAVDDDVAAKNNEKHVKNNNHKIPMNNANIAAAGNGPELRKNVKVEQEAEGVIQVSIGEQKDSLRAYDKDPDQDQDHDGKERERSKEEKSLKHISSQATL